MRVEDIGEDVDRRLVAAKQALLAPAHPVWATGKTATLVRAMKVMSADMENFAAMSGIELVVIDGNTRLRQFRRRCATTSCTII